MRQIRQAWCWPVGRTLGGGTTFSCEFPKGAASRCSVAQSESVRSVTSSTGGNQGPPTGSPRFPTRHSIGGRPEGVSAVSVGRPLRGFTRTGRVYLRASEASPRRHWYRQTSLGSSHEFGAGQRPCGSHEGIDERQIDSSHEAG